MSCSLRFEAPGSAPELAAFLKLHHDLLALGVNLEARTAVQSAVSRRAGLFVICGPAGAGKTTLAEQLSEHSRIPLLGDLRLYDDIVRALERAEHEPVIGVVRSGESRGLSSRWQDMGIPRDLVPRASVTIITLRRLPRAERGAPPRDVLVVEILGPDGSALTASLAEQAKALVSTGLVSDEAARSHVPG